MSENEPEKNHNKLRSISPEQYGKIYLSDLEIMKGAASEPLVYMALLFYANDKDIAYPSIGTLCEKTGLSESSVSRAIRKLKKRKAIEPYKKIIGKVVRYKILRGSKPTPVNCDIPTPVNCDIPTPVNCDMGPQSIVTSNSLKEKRTEKAICLLAKEDKLFSLLWERWNKNTLCLWHSFDHMKDWMEIKNRITDLWLDKGFDKNLYFELQNIDAYLIVSTLEIKGRFTAPYSGNPRLWGRDKWRGKLYKWLSSPLPSIVNAKKKKIWKHVIDVPVEHVEPSPKKDTNKPLKNQNGDTPSINGLQEHLKELVTVLNSLPDSTIENWEAFVEWASKHNQKHPISDSDRKTLKDYPIANDYLDAIP